MSLQGKGFWMSKDADCLSNGEIAYDNALRIEPKRPHQWLIDGGETQLFPNKKQAVEIPTCNVFAGAPASTLSAWGNVSGFNSVPCQFSERFFNSETTRTINIDDRNIMSISAGNLNVGRKIVDDPFSNTTSFDLSITQSMEGPILDTNYGGIRKVKVSEVTDSENVMPTSLASSYPREDTSAISTAHEYDKVDDSGISMGLAFGQDEDNVIAIGDSFCRENDNYMPMGQSFSKADGGVVAMAHNFKADNNALSIANSLVKGGGDLMSVTENFSKGESNVVSMGILSKGGDNIITNNQANKDSGSSIPCNDGYKRGGDRTSLFAQSSNRGGSHNLSLSNAFNEGKSNIISFGGYNDDDVANASGRLINSYDLLMGQPSISRSHITQKDLVVSDAFALLNNGQVMTSVPQSAAKKKEDQKSAKKIPPNNFPSNVRSLLSTGILDDVPVKYIAWSREKELRGIIKGTGYLCGCPSCSFSKVINAYEFEQHASCKTKHPNNHIYFDNGKTIYGIVQELRSTPQNMLFDVIQTVTGSPINQKSFRLWKESFLAATRELQRIYGKDERNQLF